MTLELGHSERVKNLHHVADAKVCCEHLNTLCSDCSRGVSATLAGFGEMNWEAVLGKLLESARGFQRHSFALPGLWTSEGKDSPKDL